MPLCAAATTRPSGPAAIEELIGKPVPVSNSHSKPPFAIRQYTYPSDDPKIMLESASSAGEPFGVWLPNAGKNHCKLPSGFRAYSSFCAKKYTVQSGPTHGDESTCWSMLFG